MLRNNLVKKTNLMHYLSSVYFVNKPIHVSGIFVAHQQDEYKYSIYTYIKIGMYPAEKGAV
jgi:hypothetical protein